MFTIIAGVIGLGIAVALLIVGANYLGAAYSNSTAKAQATSLANLGQQIQGAVQLAVVEGKSRATLADLVTGEYIASVPSFTFATVAGSVATNGAVVTLPLVAGPAAALCAQVPVIGGGASVADVAAFTAATSRFACDTTNASFFYRVQ